MATSLFGDTATGVGAGGQAATGGGTNIFYEPSPAAGTFPTFQANNAGNAIQIGGQMAQILGLTSGPHVMSELLHAYEDLSQTQLSQLQGLLYKAGYYTTSTGASPNTPPSLGQHDDQSFQAFAQALMTNMQAGATNLDGSPRSLDQTIDDAISGGGGAALAQQGNPLVGGGNVYKIDLTNPADIALTARTVFQTALGRAPTQKELDAVVQTVQSGQTAAGTAGANAQEGGQQRMFAAQEAARQAQNAPAVALGPIPNGPFANVDQWAVAFLRYLGDPVTVPNISTIIGWSKAAGQGMNGNNPLGITLAQPGSAAIGQGPAQSAQKYQQPSDGMKAAAQTLANFPALSAALKSGNAQSALSNKAIQDELNQFSSGAYRDITKQATSSAKAATAANLKWGDKNIAAGGAATPAQTPAARAAGEQAQANRGANPPDLQGQGAPGGAGTVPADVLAAYGGHPPPDVMATFQAAQQNPAVAAYLQSQAQARSGAGVVPGDVQQAYGGNVPGDVQATFQAAAQNPAVAAYLTQQAQQAQGSMVGPGGMGQQPQAAGTAYLPGQVFSDVAGPSADAAAFQAATTGANRTPYLGYQYLNAFQAIMDMVHSGGLLTGGGG